MNRAVRTLFISVGLALSTTPILAAPASNDRRFAATDIFGLETVSDTQISPSGAQIVYVRLSYDIMSDRQRSSLWIIDADGRDHRALYADAFDHRSPRWSPDGKRLAFISTTAGKAQLFVRWMDTGQTAVLTNLTESPGDLTWAPDGRSLVFSQLVRSEPSTLAQAPTQPEGATWAPPVTVVDAMVYRLDGAGYLRRGFTHYFSVSADGGTARQLTTGDFDHSGAPSFTPDGRQLIFSANRNADWEYAPLNRDLYSLDLATRSIQPIVTRQGPDTSPAVSPNGKLVAYTGFDDRRQGYQVTHLYVANIDGSGARVVSGNFDRDVEDPVWARDSRSLYFVYDESGIRRIGKISLDGRVRELARGVGAADVGRPYTGGGFSVADSGRVAFALNSTERPGDVAILNGGKVRTLTTLNEDLLGHKELGRVERLTWKSSHDGREIEGWLVQPPGFETGRKYPLILEIHGGPFTAYGPNFSVEVQRFVAAGYAVLYTNPRGSTSYGAEFGNLIHHAYPGNDYDDLMSGVDAAIARGFIDPNNLFVTGGSGGGVLTSWIVGKTNRFRAAVVAKPVINWTSFALTADLSNFFYQYWFAGAPWDVQSEYWRRSPLSLVGNVTTPTMLITGEEDYRTPIAETEQYYQALRLRKVPTAMVRMPGASHGMTGRPSQFIAKIDNILAWFDRYRTDAKPATPLATN